MPFGAWYTISYLPLSSMKLCTMNRKKNIIASFVFLGLVVMTMTAFAQELSVTPKNVRKVVPLPKLVFESPYGRITKTVLSDGVTCYQTQFTMACIK